VELGRWAFPRCLLRRSICFHPARFVWLHTVGPGGWLLYQRKYQFCGEPAVVEMDVLTIPFGAISSRVLAADPVIEITTGGDDHLDGDPGSFFRSLHHGAHERQSAGRWEPQFSRRHAEWRNFRMMGSAHEQGHGHGARTTLTVPHFSGEMRGSSIFLALTLAIATTVVARPDRTPGGGNPQD